jgi:serine/threonine protein kinase
MIDTQVRILPLTVAFPCNDSALENRALLYAAFLAARDLLKNIEKDAEEFVKSSASEKPIQDSFPDVQSLRRFIPRDSQQEEEEAEQLYFQIIDCVDQRALGRFLYVANDTEKHTQILVKFTKRYSKELHEFCVSQGFAPRLLAFEELPGGWLGVAMEFLSSAFRVADSPSLVEQGERWLKRMDEIVETLHEHGYVHGDLRAPNFIVDGEKLCLVDFDWGGKEGQVKFPDVELHPILGDNRGMLIRKDHDLNVLANTKEAIGEEIEKMRKRSRAC